MADSGRVEVTIRATDEASRTLQQVRGELEAVGAAGQRHITDLTTRTAAATSGLAAWNAQMTGLRQSIDALRPAVSSLVPALDATSGALVNAASGVTALSGGMVGLAVVGAQVAAELGASVITALRQSREEFRAFQRDVNSFDASRITGQVRTIKSEIEILDQRLKELRTTPEGLNPFGLLERIYLETFRAPKLQGRQAEAIEAQRFQQFGGSPALPAPGQEDQEVERARRFLELRDQQRGLFDFRMHQLDAQAARASREADDLFAAGQGAAAARLRAAAAEQRRFGLFRTFRAPDYQADYDESRAFFPLPPNLVQQLETIAQRARMELPEYERQREADLRGAAVAGDESRAFGVTREQLQAGSQAALRERIEIGREQIEQERSLLEIQLQQADLSDRQRDSLVDRLTGLRSAADLKRIEAELEVLQAAREEERDNARIERLQQERELVLAVAQARAGVLAREREVRDDPLAGARAGLEDFERQAERAGDRFRTAMLSSMQTLSSGITEVLVQGISGDFDRIGDIGKQMGQALMRALLQELVVTPVVATLSQAIRGALGNLGGSLGLGGAATAAGVGGGALLLGAPASASAAGLASSAPVGSIVQTAAGPAVVSASGALVLSGGPASSALLSRGEPSPDLLGGVGDGGSLIGASSGGGFTVTGALGAAAGVAVVGVSAYSAYQTARTTQDVVFAGVTGAVGGGVAGAQIGSYFGESGYGALIGAVAGAAISAGAAAFGKSQNRANRDERERAEMQGAGASFQPMFAELDAATDAEEFRAVIQRYSHQGAGGQRSGRNEAEAGLVVTVLSEQGPKRALDQGLTPDQLLDGAARGTSVQIVLGVAQATKAPFEERIASAIKSAAERIKRLDVRFFFTERLRGGISRTTVLGLARLAEATGKDINVVAATLQGLDPATWQKIMDRIAANDIDGAVGLYAVEANLQAVRVGAFTRSGPASAQVPLTPQQARNVSDLLNEAQGVGVQSIEELVRQGILNASPGGGEAGPDGTGVAGPSITGVTVNGPNINVTLSNNETVTITPSEPSGIAGQIAAAGLTAMGVPGAIANAIGSGVDLGISFGLGGLAGVINSVAGRISLAARGKSAGMLGLPTIAVTPPSSGRGLDPDEGFTVDDDAPPGTVTVGEVTIADSPGGGGPTGGTAGGGTGGVGAGGTGSSGDPSAYGEGGWVPGDPRKGDVVPARLTPGEYVVPAAAATENAQLLEDLAQRKPGRFPRQAPDRPMSDEEVLRIGHRLFALNLKHDLGWFPGATNNPLTAARTF